MDPEIIVATTTSYPRMHDTFGNEDKLRKIVEENWAVEIFWFPFNSFPFDLTNDEIWVRTFNKTFLDLKRLRTPSFMKPKMHTTEYLRKL